MSNRDYFPGITASTDIGSFSDNEFLSDILIYNALKSITKENFSDNNNDEGICRYVENYITVRGFGCELSCLSRLNQLFEGWDKHSGNHVYPIPDPEVMPTNGSNIDTSYAAFNAYNDRKRDKSQTFFDGEYGALRFELIEYTKRKLEKQLVLEFPFDCLPENAHLAFWSLNEKPRSYICKSFNLTDEEFGRIVSYYAEDKKFVIQCFTDILIKVLDSNKEERSKLGVMYDFKTNSRYGFDAFTSKKHAAIRNEYLTAPEMFSGNLRYPVKAPNNEDPSVAYHRLDMWTGEFGHNNILYISQLIEAMKNS
ncbi:hypothetical protein KNT64_gp191 [Pseudomonas phage PspYZU05]|uniref:Uncharacterized protein n=1 Tax=Pseudomonas phage PspYZU05 TaxID=1983556 RepID=A0A2U7N8E7_9CAUD|nr:hypothetical protein KNT64_gp191 [Pseudomonas phage PspYZU05]ASD52143.1 hypothetical protein PspYZU05_191 [Pseudomonas phage PspYZU05]